MRPTSASSVDPSVLNASVPKAPHTSSTADCSTSSAPAAFEVRALSCSSSKPNFARIVATMGGCPARHCAYSGCRISSACDSLRPAIRTMRRCRRSAAERAASGPSTSASNIGFNSRGGPGSRSTTRGPSSIHCPGAVPLGLSSSVAPSMTNPCRRLMSGICMPRRANLARMRSIVAWSSRMPRPSTRATASRVRSSSVGPSPPVSTSRSLRDNASRTSDARSSDVVAHDRLGPHLDPETVEPGGDVQRIRVGAIRLQHLAADRDDLGTTQRRQRGHDASIVAGMSQQSARTTRCA